MREREEENSKEEDEDEDEEGQEPQTGPSPDHVYVLYSNMKWVVRRGSGVRATAVVDTKTQAVRIARAIARETGSVLVIAKT